MNETGLVENPKPEKQSSDKVPETESLNINKDELCLWHHQPLTLYCEIREESLCVECLNNQYKTGASKIISIDEAYRYRVASIYNTLSLHLFGRREQLEAQARRIEFRVSELNRLQATIERDMQSEFRGIFERLSSAFNSNAGLIQSDIKSLTEDIENLAFLISTLEHSDQDFIKFLSNFKSIKQELEKSISKPFRSDIKVSPTDLPRELEIIRGLSSRCLALKSLVQFKNDIIWKFLHERVPSCKVSKEAEKELKNWAELSEKFSTELEKFNMKCDFCSEFLEEDNVNSQCLKNSSYVLNFEGVSKYPPNFRGNGRHYFIKIVKEKPEATKEVPKYADVDDKVLQKISKTARAKQLDVEKIFNMYDMMNSGYLSPTDFYYLMIEAFSLNGEEITELIFKFDKAREGRVNYKEILKEITAKLPEPFQKLREQEKKFLELSKKKDRLVEGAIGLEVFKDVLRQLNLNSEEIEEALKLTTKNKRGKVLYSEFHDRII